MSVAQIAPPLIEPLALMDLKQHLRVEHADEDDLLEALITAARSHVEAKTGTVLISQTFRQYLDEWPDGYVELRRFPVSSIEAISIYGKDGEPSQLPLEEAKLDGVSRPCRLDLRNRPSPKAGMNGIEIDFIAGFGMTSVDVPSTLRRAILELSAHWYEFRGAVAPYQHPISVPASFEALIHPFRTIHL